MTNINEFCDKLQFAIPIGEHCLAWSCKEAGQNVLLEKKFVDEDRSVQNLWEGIPEGVKIGIYFLTGVVLVDKILQYFKMKGNNNDGNGPGGAAPGGGAGDRVPAMARAPSGDAQFSLDPEIVREMEYRVTESRRIHAIDTYEPNNVTSWKISLAPAVAVSVYYAAGLAIDASLAALAKMAFAGETVGAIAGGVGMVGINFSWSL